MKDKLNEALRNENVETQTRLAAAEQNALKWVEYDGRLETLPPNNGKILLLSGNTWLLTNLILVDIYNKETDEGQLRWGTPTGHRPLLNGDRWAYLPTMEDAS